MSEEEAFDFCEAYFNSSLGFQACRELPALQSDKAIADCVLDIQVYYITSSKSMTLIQYF